MAALGLAIETMTSVLDVEKRTTTSMGESDAAMAMAAGVDVHYMRLANGRVSNVEDAESFRGGGAALSRCRQSSIDSRARPRVRDMLIQNQLRLITLRVYRDKPLHLTTRSVCNSDDLQLRDFNFI